MLPIQKKLIKYNFNAGGNQIKYIVVHDTGNPGASAENHYKYFNGGNRGASAHYFVDEGNIIQIIEDNDRAWHVGDNKGKSDIKNSNSIGIEMCIIGKDIEKEFKNTIELTAHLMKKHNIPMERVVRHYDASGKSCPNIMKPNNWAKWTEFKTLVAIELKGGVEKMTKAEVVKIVNDIIRPSANGENPKHWAEAAFKELTEKRGVVIHQKRFDDNITRGEVFSFVNEVLKTLKS